MIDLVSSLQETISLQNALPEGLKTEVDLKRYEVILAEVKPQVIIECGTFRGASALWFADTANCKVITIDICPLLHWNIMTRWAGRVRHLIGPSTHPALIEHVTDIVKDMDPVMVVLDSDHSGPHVAAEMKAYAPLVTPGSYCVVEDGIARYATWFNFVGSPLDAIEDWLALHGDEWENNEEIEYMFPTTQHLKGWLRRKVVSDAV